MVNLEGYAKQKARRVATAGPISVTVIGVPEDDTAAAEAALARIEQSGWLAVMSHSAHAHDKPELIMV